ncbi:SufE family protein [Marispirochaeta aestuarii]|uniref:SufE family protein n=1 Tax=Marispirochaeta aestuarii TaxID=1963862 RepID=UPI002ABE54B0|nr:SufE family protein [Marispirochaeta aestuarii]
MRISDLREDLNLLSSWEERFEYVIDLGKDLPAFPENRKTEEYRVRGCMSRVWVYPRWEETDNTRVFRLLVESDSAIVKGLAAVLVMRYDGVPEADLPEDSSGGLFSELGFAEHISPSRRNGLAALEGRIRSFIDE